MNQSIIHIPNFLNNSEFVKITNHVDEFMFDDEYPGWKLTGYSNCNDTSRPFWFLNLRNSKLFYNHYFDMVKNKLFDIVNENVRLYHVYLNGATYGQQGYYHTDCNLSNTRTLLIYCNREWKEEWAGGTVFDENGKITTIYPKPLSAVYFDSTISHFSQPVSADFTGLRVTLAYKLILT
jgi:hypothetical protein